VEIPKPGGKGKRMLGIPTVVDRLIQQAIQQVMQGAVDGTFSESSYGFRPGRSALQAVEKARNYVRGGYRWVVDLDLEKFFDRVNHDILMALVARRLKDKRLLRLIRRYLEAGMMSGGIESPREQGTPQGSPLSPLLSNIMLDELDKELERRGHRFVRYADDCNVYVRSRRAGERVFGSIEKWLAERLRLTVNRAKSAVDRPWKRKFLGYAITWHREAKLMVAHESIRRLKDKLREHFRRGRGRNIRRVIGDLTPMLRGWLNYFSKSEIKACFEETDQWIRRKVRCILWRQWKRPRTRMKKLMARGLPKERAWKSANNGRGPWWNAGASHMNHAYQISWFRESGLYFLMENYLEMRKVP
jgi:RNA-directed DNA polymerase